MKAIVLDKIGKINVLKISEIEKPEPKDNEILIKIKYSGVNYADLLSRQGLYSWAPKRPYILGLEVTGIVEKIGKNVTSFEVGDKVIAGTQLGGYAEYITIEEKYVLKAIDKFTWEENGAIGVQWFTSWMALHEIARARENEILLVQAGAGGVGTGAIQLGKAHKMEIYATASSKQKLEFVKSLGATPLAYSDFDEVLIKLNKRPNCILETIGGDIFKRSFNVLAPLGRIVLIGASGIQLNKYNPISWFNAWRSIPKAKMSQVLRQSKGFMGLHVGYLMQFPEILKTQWDKMVEVINTNNLKPVINKNQIFPMSKVAEAHQLMHDRKNIGKILLDPSN